MLVTIQHLTEFDLGCICLQLGCSLDSCWCNLLQPQYKNWCWLGSSGGSPKGLSLGRQWGFSAGAALCVILSPNPPINPVLLTLLPPSARLCIVREWYFIDDGQEGRAGSLTSLLPSHGVSWSSDKYYQKHPCSYPYRCLWLLSAGAGEGSLMSLPAHVSTDCQGEGGFWPLICMEVPQFYPNTLLAHATKSWGPGAVWSRAWRGGGRGVACLLLLF